MRRGVLWLLTIVGLALGVAVWHPARVAVQTLLLLPALFPSAPVDPLGLVTPTPTREERSYPYASGRVDASLFHAVGSGQHGAIILLLGAGDLPRSDLAVHFAEALARLGVVTLVPESSGMLAERLTFDEVDAVRASVDLLRGLPEVDAERIGLVGLSASGGLGIVAAGQPDLRDRVRFVNSFGSYADASSLLLEVLSRSIDVRGEIRPWQPEPRTVDVVHQVEMSAHLAQVGGGRDLRQGAHHWARHGGDRLLRLAAGHAAEHGLLLRLVDTRVTECVGDDLDRARLRLPCADLPTHGDRATDHVKQQATGIGVAAEAVHEADPVAHVWLTRRDDAQPARGGQADQPDAFGVHLRQPAQQ